jgi:hypothetical protein
MIMKVGYEPKAAYFLLIANNCLLGIDLKLTQKSL